MNRILITGGAGFIAHHIIKEILDTTDWEIVSLDKLSKIKIEWSDKRVH